MKIVFISDSHSQHYRMTIPDGDMIIHAGDLSSQGDEHQLAYFLKWFSELPHTHKVFIAGNHDFLAERDPSVFRALIPKNCIYLENESVEIEGLTIWGSPVTPWFYDWAFNVHRGAPIARYWDRIPDKTDILITHGPPHGILDKTKFGKLAGCEELLRRVKQVEPKIHVFGHIHEGYGERKISPYKTQFINASVMDVQYRMVNPPIVKIL
jgi:Icc-related predicted phosphoesterase